MLLNKYGTTDCLMAGGITVRYVVVVVVVVVAAAVVVVVVSICYY